MGRLLEFLRVHLGKRLSRHENGGAGCDGGKKPEFLNIYKINLSMLSDCVQVGHEKKGGMKSNSHISSLGSKEDSGATNRVTECRGKGGWG